MKSLINKITNTTSGLDTIPLRVGAGIVFIAHGSQKLFGWLGGYGLEATAGWMSSIGLEPGLLMATLAGSAEFFGGLFLIAGLLVRPTALILAVTMVVAILSVHIQNGLFMDNNGYEFALSLLAVSLGLVIRGGGSLSVDRLIQEKIKL